MYATNIKPFIYFRKTNNVFIFFPYYIPCKELNVGQNFKNYRKNLCLNFLGVTSPAHV
jgi:hypothetical protein